MKMKKIRTTLGDLRNGNVLPGWRDSWQGFADEISVIVYQDGSMKVGDSDLVPLLCEAYGNAPPEGWEELPWEEPSG